MSRTTPAANGGGTAAELRNWARGCHSTEAAVELLIRAPGGRFLEPGQPWLRTDDRGITWLDAQVRGLYSDAVSSGERHILALVEALALGKPLEDVGGLMASLDPYHLDLVLAVLRHAGSGRASTFLRRLRWRLLVTPDDESRSISMSRFDRNSAPRPAPTVAVGRAPQTFPRRTWRGLALPKGSQPLTASRRPWS
jgi:hypothetical protein